MRHLDLQQSLQALGCYTGALDGLYGKKSRAGVLQALTMGEDRPVTRDDMLRAARRLRVPLEVVIAVRDVEASGDPFIDGRPVILFEPHRFSRATARRWDATHPSVSYARWDRTRYPRTQWARYQQLLDAVGLDVDAGFASASYGAFQVLGENHAICGFRSPFEFALAQSKGEAEQLDAFVSFVEAKGLAPALRRRDFPAFADAYNGTASRLHHYAERLADAVARAGAAIGGRRHA